MICEFEDCETKKEATVVLRLNSNRGSLQCSMRLGNRIPAKIGVCNDCAYYLVHKAEFDWSSDGLDINDFAENVEKGVYGFISFKKQAEFDKQSSTNNEKRYTDENER